MVKAHTPINWENEPSFNTPINETNLNKMDATIGVLDDRIIEQETSKLDKSTAYTMVKDISFNENNGVFTVTRLNGSTFTIDTRLEKIAINFKYDYSTQKLIITLIDGTTQSIDMSALLTQYEFTDSATLDFTTDSNGKVTATIKNGSITEDMLRPNYLADIKVETEKSAQSMANAKISENNAKQSELNAKASEEKALEYSNNAQPLAQSVSGNNPTATNSTDGKVIYLENSGYTSQDGEPTPTTPIHISGLADKGYFDGELKQGYYAINDGKFNSSTKWVSCNNPIYCKPNDIVKISYEEVQSVSIVYFNGSAFVSGETSSKAKEYSFTVPSGVDRFYFNVNNVNDITPSTAKHICVTINGTYAVSVKTCGKNLIKNIATSKIINGLTFTVNNDGSVNVSGTCTDYTDIKIGEFKPKIGERYTFTSESEAVVNKYNCNANNINGVNSWKYDGHSFEATTEDTVSVYVVVYAGATLTNYTVKPMIRLASDTDATYEPHQETEALIPTSSPFYEGDYIEVYADGSGQIVRNTVLDTLKNATYVYSTFSENGGNIQYLFGDYSTIYKKTVPYCNCFPRQEAGNWNKYNNTISYGGDNGELIQFSVSSDIATTLTEWNNFINTLDIYVLYKLATPTSTPLTAEQVAEFLKIRTYRGVTHVTADGEVTVRYYCDNASGETVSMLQSSLPQTYSREFEWLSPKLGHVQYFDFYFDKSYSKPPIVIPAVRGAGAQGIIPHVSYVNEEKCSITLYNAVDYSSNTMPVIVGGNVDILVY